MVETTGKQSVRITLRHSGLHPPIYILASFTDPPWEPHEMNYGQESMPDTRNPGMLLWEHMFWRRFDISPGIWKYKYRVGQYNWIIYDAQAEKEIDSSGEEYNVLRVEEGGPKTLDSPAALPISGSETSSSWRSAPEDPSESLASGQRRDSSPLPVRRFFSLSPSDFGEGGSDDSEQHLVGDRDMEAITQSRSLPGSEASVESQYQDSFFAVCWQGVIARIYTLFDKVFGRFQST